ncbi:EpsD family peptidyl-prolyl cis-trans isomerase [Candidatus Symbiobacter mobilis]|uniref:peptidylprolyl isomerase n=1 Tax=Candidatus Symbiobacter mobilis CR TaxID=946483 RepID=U5N7G4_9BURK|nr:EpsD family peptidyl-prolyl cis-trans isomerase [Candidatus Symbiobacter mobilis]AGX87461.1 hypothetical protein Cenrod_1374 [Candidatus Symbiobacter mobilis CR]
MSGSHCSPGFCSTPFHRLLLVALLVGLAACGKKDGASSQVAAKVGSEEISVHQVNQVLARSRVPSDSPQAVQQASREAIERLIDQSLAVQQAVEQKLDRTPETIAALEEARRDVLARAYFQKIMAGMAKPTTQECEQYYAEHPELFAARRVYNVQEVLVPANAGVLDTLRTMAAAGKSAEEVAVWLKGKGVKFGGGSATRSAEQIPLDLLTKVHALKDGQSVVLESPETLTYLRVVASRSAPVDQATALPRIEQFLQNKRSSDAVKDELARLRAAKPVEYVGEFGSMTPAAPAVSPVPVEPAVQPVQGDARQTAIEKGVAGLK